MRAHRFVVLLLPLLLAAQSLQEFEKKVTEFTLANGLHFIVVERHEAPVVSFHTYVNAGSVDDPSGATGIAHMFEHMAFKGTESIGSENWPEEKKAIDQVEAVYGRLDAERNEGVKADPQNAAAPEAELKAPPPCARATECPKLNAGSGSLTDMRYWAWFAAKLAVSAAGWRGLLALVSR